MVNWGKVIWAGALGGILGALVMTAILIGSKAMMKMPLMADFMVMGTFAGGRGEAAITVGLGAHLLVGIIDGVIFAVITTAVSKLRITSLNKGVLLGVVYGFLVWLVVFIPVMNTGFAPIMMKMMGPMAMAMAPTVMLLGLVEHLIFGAILGATVATVAKKAISA